MATSRKTKLKIKRAKQLEGLARKIEHERKIKADLGTEIFGYWQMLLDETVTGVQNDRTNYPAQTNRSRKNDWL